MSRAPLRTYLRVENLVTAAYLVLGLLLLALVFQSIHFRGETNYRTSEEYKSFAEHERQLASIRRYIGQAVNSLRDYLINNNTNSARVYEDDVRRAKSAAARARSELNSWSSQKFVLVQMDRDLADYWALLEKNRPKTVDEKEEHGFSLVHEQILPARDEVFNSIRLLEDRVRVDRETMVRRYATKRRNDLIAIFSYMGAIILISLLLASGYQKFRRDFQKESRRKFEDMILARNSLEQLSGRLLRIQEDERRKISRELHDGIGQLLTALRMEIHQVQFSSGNIASNSQDRLLRARKLAEEAVCTVKDISLLLRPPLLDDLGLEPAITWLIEQFRRRTGITCHFRARNLREHLPDDLKTCIFRVLQEALNNCEKHASPSEVDIALEQTHDTLTLCVEDDGAGFQLDDHNVPAMQAGLGILGMRERVTLLGGSLRIESRPGHGTKLLFILPVVKIASREVLVLSTPKSA